MAKYIMAHDMGTSSDKAVLVDFSGNIVATAVEPYPTFYPNPAWVEQNPEDYWQAVCKAGSRIINENSIAANEARFGARIGIGGGF